ncbi:hypothetical protein B296_00007773 [Ensete ventricosum]|uniref:Uncharacterized protein n=1 Tax=Ensete ventricosum TaxID=4639 RepID=A0A427B8E9_ENSVE|nr:hypothetical protein B296_00007773 [Ensete ventricosum]
MGRDIDNFPPFLLKEEAKQVMRLRGILYFKAVQSMSEDWLVEAGLNMNFNGMEGLFVGQVLHLGPSLLSTAIVAQPGIAQKAIVEVERP